MTNNRKIPLYQKLKRKAVDHIIGVHPEVARAWLDIDMANSYDVEAGVKADSSNPKWLRRSVGNRVWILVREIEEE